MKKSTELRILELLFNDLTRQYSMLEIAKLLKIQYPQAHRSIQSLIKKKLVDCSIKGKAKLISLKKDFTGIEYVLAELSKRDKALKKYLELRMVFESLNRISKLQYICIVFGSYAKGTPKKNSDIDLLFVIPKDYNYGKFEIMARNAFVAENVDINIILDDSLHEMWSNPQKLNIGNELLKGHIILKGVEYFLDAWRKHNVG